MDIIFFLHRRIKFLRQFYSTASSQYVERKRKIEGGEKPFVPPCDECGELPFQLEWAEADESLQVLAYSCISMLAAALHLYFKAWVRESRVRVDEHLKKNTFKKQGWFNGYRKHFSQCFLIDFDDAPANLDLIKEIILARNRIEHPTSIVSQTTSYGHTDLNMLSHPFFIDERERNLLGGADQDEKQWLYYPEVHASEEKILAAIVEVERFCNWFEQEIKTKILSVNKYHFPWLHMIYCLHNNPIIMEAIWQKFSPGKYLILFGKKWNP